MIKNKDNLNSGNSTLSTDPNPEHDHIKGPSSAAVTLVEYGDYECPYTGQAYPIVKEIQKILGDKLQFVFRNFPLIQIHPHAFNAALAAETASSQGKFWQMHDYLFEHQRKLDDDSLKEYAKDLGMNTDNFNCEFSDRVYISKVKDDLISGQNSNVGGTPTFFVNGILYDDSYDFDTLLSNLKNIINKDKTKI